MNEENANLNNDHHDISLVNIEIPENIKKQIYEVAIERIGSDLSNTLVAVKRREFIDARNQIDVPHGLFGLNLENFYKRLKENTVYLDVLQMVPKEILEKAKICIILDELNDLITRLFQGFKEMNPDPVLQEIKDSVKLLTIHEEIAEDFQKNSETMQKLRDKSNAFQLRERNAIMHMNSQIHAIQNVSMESELILEPIEYRYKMSFHERSIEQLKIKCQQFEDNLKDTLSSLEEARYREDIASDCVIMKQRRDIEMLKIKFEEMTERYDREYEDLDAKISYNKNSIEAMRNQKTDCEEKMKFYAVEIIKLEEWKENWEQKKLEEAQAQSLTENKQKKKKDQKKKKAKKNK